ncbi:hypothetical protein ACLOJK_001616 [Asimina triloba]
MKTFQVLLEWAKQDTIEVDEQDVRRWVCRLVESTSANCAKEVFIVLKWAKQDIIEVDEQILLEWAGFNLKYGDISGSSRMVWFESRGIINCQLADIAKQDIIEVDEQGIIRRAKPDTIEVDEQIVLEWSGLNLKYEDISGPSRIIWFESRGIIKSQHADIDEFYYWRHV